VKTPPRGSRREGGRGSPLSHVREAGRAPAVPAAWDGIATRPGVGSAHDGWVRPANGRPRLCLQTTDSTGTARARSQDRGRAAARFGREAQHQGRAPSGEVDSRSVPGRDAVRQVRERQELVSSLLVGKSLGHWPMPIALERVLRTAGGVRWSLQLPCKSILDPMALRTTECRGGARSSSGMCYAERAAMHSEGCGIPPQGDSASPLPRNPSWAAARNCPTSAAANPHCSLH
jgi:hypothetical protein